MNDLRERVARAICRAVYDNFAQHMLSDDDWKDWLDKADAAIAAGVGALPDVEAVSASVHEDWMASKRKQHIASRKSEAGEELMVPYADLSEPAKDLDRGTVKSVYAAIEALSAPTSPVPPETGEV